MKRAACYCRVSHPKQVKEGHSLEFQKEKLPSNARTKGYTVDAEDVFVEAGITGKNDNRPEYNRMLAAVVEGHYQAVFVYDITRLTRTASREEQGRIIKILADAGCDLYTDSSHYDLNKPESRFQFGIGAEVALLDNSLRAQKVKEGRAEARKKGKNPGTPPATGYRKHYTSDGKLKYIMDAVAIAPVKLAYELALKGAGGSRIRKELFARGFKTSTGQPLSNTHVYQWLRNPTYAGYVHVGYARGSKVKEKGMWPADFIDKPLVTIEEWKQVQGYLEARSRTNHTRYPLSGLITCASCGETLTGSYKGSAQKKYYFCIPSGNEVERYCPGHNGKSILMSVAHSLLISALPEILARYNKSNIEMLQVAPLEDDTRTLKTELARLEKAILRNYQEKDLDEEPSEYKMKHIRSLESKAKALKKSLKEMEATPIDIPSIAEWERAVEFLHHDDFDMLDDISKTLFTKLHFKREGTHRRYTYRLVSCELKTGEMLLLDKVPAFIQ